MSSGTTPRWRRAIAACGRRLIAFAEPGGHRHDRPDRGAPNERFVESPPSVEHAVGLFTGEWSTRLPIDAPTGTVDLIDDARLVTGVAALGGITGGDVLELGPLEGAHSITLRRLGARRVVAIEANTGAYLRCLVAKEVTGLDAVEFRLGDFRPYLASTTDRYDLAVAIGVLYHLDDPVPVLRDLARVTDRLVVWTHVHTDSIAGTPLARRFDAPVERTLDDVAYRLHPYRYLDSLAWKGFCGGTRPTAAWIARDDLLAVVHALGFAVVHRDDHDHEHGPAITLALRRR